jgi:heptaprenyl diphosphate synthase
VIDALTEYGNAGIVFQIVDDILDITATNGELGKPAGHDMVEGVRTVIRTLAVE